MRLAAARAPARPRGSSSNGDDRSGLISLILSPGIDISKMKRMAPSQMQPLFLFPLFLFLVLPSSFPISSSEPTQDRAALLDFLNRTPHAGRIRWNQSVSACQWVGVTCDANRSAVIALRLPGSGLQGPIPPGTLSRLSSLRVLSLRSNALSGPIPPDLLSNLTLLRSFYLQGNRLSGPIPDAIGRATRLLRIDLSSNNISGEIPFAVGNLTRLTGLFLQNNSLSGKIPGNLSPLLTGFSVANNRLNGSIPASLSRFPESAFAGNLQLCGSPLPPCNPFFPSPAPAPSGEVGGTNPDVGESGRKKKKKKLSKGAIIAIAVVGAVLLGLILLSLLICIVVRRRRGATSGAASKKTSAKSIATAAATGGAGTRSTGTSGLTAAETGTSSTSKEDVVRGGVAGSAAAGADGGERNKLVFLEDGVYSFDLEDLLRASAEVLGKGTVGTSYKAVLEEGTTVVVKRLKDVVVSKKEFESQVEAAGRGVRPHLNVLPLRAYYFSKDEKLLVYDYVPAGSLYAMLHGSRGSGRPPLDWDNRLRVALAAGRGLAHLHQSAALVHGNLKASNVLLRQDPDAAALSDYGLSPLFPPSTSAISRGATGYRAPEAVDPRRLTFKSDVYSYGVLLLELLTGKSPNQLSVGEDGIDLPRWVQSVVREEWTAEVFDVELLRSGQNIEEEMVQLLQVAMTCVTLVPDSRPDMPEALRMVEDVANRGEPEEARRPSSDDPSKTGSGGPTPPAAATP